MRKLLRFLGFLSFAIVLLLKVLALTESIGWISPNVLPILQVFDIIATVLIFAIGAILQRFKSEDIDSIQANNRAVLIQAVHNNWIKGVLDEALKDATFDIAVETRPEKAGDSREPRYRPISIPVRKRFSLQSLLNVSLRWKNQQATMVTPQAIPQIFHNASEKLLILGAPGSGKTVLLLELAKALLREADRDESKSVPVVFNLASWGTKQQPLREWLTAELKRYYGVDKNLATDWINSDSLIYLLDGLDEIAEDAREDCLKTINAFISVPRQIAICSRIGEYELLSDKLNAHDAIELLPLDKQQVENVFVRHLSTDTTKDIMKWITADDAIWQEVNKPLFINILISTYIGSKPFSSQPLKSDAENQIHQHIIEPFVVQQLRNNPYHKYANDDTLRYLSWIAHNLESRNLSQFYVEMIQGEWLPAHSGNLSMTKLVRKISINLERRFVIIPHQIIYVILYGVKSSIWYVLFLFISFFVSDILINGTISYDPVRLIFALIMGIVIGGLIASVNERTQISQRSYINQGFTDTTKLSAIIGLTVGVVVSVLSGLTMGLIAGLISGLIHGRFNNVIKHVIIRITLYHEKLAPRRYDHFLHHMVERRIMRRVGGSVLFVHRYILEYFADQWKQKYQQDHES